MPWVNGQWEGDPPSVEEFFGDDQPRCGCCHSEGVPIKLYRKEFGDPFVYGDEKQGIYPYIAYCEVCAGTFLTLLVRSNQDYRIKLLGKSLGAIANGILKSEHQSEQRLLAFMANSFGEVLRELRNGDFEANLVNEIARRNGWLPLESNEKMVVNYGDAQYEIRRIK